MTNLKIIEISEGVSSYTDRFRVQHVFFGIVLFFGMIYSQWPSHFQPVWPYDENPFQPMSLYFVTVTLNGDEVSEGDEIAAYSTNGMLVGSVTYTGDATALTVWGDDITTDEIEGLLEGEEISLELWRKSEDKIEELTVQKWIEGGNVYSINGIAIAGDISSAVTGLGYELYPNVPNPFGAVTSISFFAPEEGDVKIGIYDMLGNLVKELTNESYNPGMYMLEFRSEDVSAGTYFVRMTAKGFSVTNTMSVVK